MKYVALALLLICCPLLVVAQTQTCPCPPRNTINVNGEGTFETDPDTAILSLTISTQEKQLKDAYGRATKAAEQIREMLRNNGVDPKDAQIGFFQVAPVYDYSKSKRKTVGFAVHSKITLKLKDFSKVATLTDSFGTLDVTGDQSISYVVSDMPSARNKAIENATQHARLYAETVATTANVKLGELVNASVQTNEQKADFRSNSLQTSTLEVTDGKSYTPPPAPTAEFGQGKVTVTAHVALEFLLK